MGDHSAVEPISTVAAIASLINAGMGISNKVLDRVDARAATTGQTRAEVFQEVANAAKASGQAGAADLSARAARLNAESWEGYDRLRPSRKLRLQSVVPGGHLIGAAREAWLWRRNGNR